MSGERRGDFEQGGRRPRRFGGTVFLRVLIAALIPFAVLFWAAWFLPGRGADGAGTLLSAGIAALILLAVSLYAATRAVVRPISRIAERADAVTEEASAVAWGDVPIAGAAREIVSLRDALIRMQDASARGSERKLAALLAELEEARRTESANARNRFGAKIACEMRIPLNAIAGIAGRFLGEKIEEKRAKYAESIKASAESLLSIIKETLDLVELESGGFSLANADYGFGETLRRLRGEASALAARKPLLQFEMRVDESVPDCLYGDEARVRQLLMNLLTNAVQRTDKGFVRFHAEADEQYLHFDISDSGTGFEREALLKRLDPIHCFAGSKNDEYSAGSAVFGLAISKLLVEEMGGSFRAKSAPGEGTVFRITLPRVDGDAAAATFLGRLAAFKAPGARVLIVDDSKFNLDVAVGLLSPYEIICDTAASGREAIDLIRRNDYDVVFMDRLMPNMDGIQTTGIIRAQGGAFGTLPIIAVMTDAAVWASDLFASSGFSDFLEKPIDIENLRALLLKWLPEQRILFAGGDAQKHLHLSKDEPYSSGAI